LNETHFSDFHNFFLFYCICLTSFLSQLFNSIGLIHSNQSQHPNAICIPFLLSTISNQWNVSQIWFVLKFVSRTKIEYIFFRWWNQFDSINKTQLVGMNFWRAELGGVEKQHELTLGSCTIASDKWWNGLQVNTGASHPSAQRSFYRCKKQPSHSSRSINSLQQPPPRSSESHQYWHCTPPEQQPIVFAPVIAAGFHQSLLASPHRKAALIKPVYTSQPFNLSLVKFWWH